MSKTRIYLLSMKINKSFFIYFFVLRILFLKNFYLNELLRLNFKYIKERKLNVLSKIRFFFNSKIKCIFSFH